MSIDSILDGIHHFGYFALFFSLWLGIVGMPIPDEVVVMTGGMVGSLHLLQTVPAYVMTYLGVVSGLSLGYILGRVMGPHVVERLREKKKIAPYIQKSDQLLEKYGSFALVISYCFPVVRHVLPYLVGVNKMPFPKYAMISYSTGLLWTTIYFIIGYYFGGNIERIGNNVYKYGYYGLAAAVIFISSAAVIKAIRKKKKVCSE
ncbi:DedA family protein [Paenibacillus chitinolyticus]|uniref:DedA family protein n=1 Tax=Paenibacillus chitinolyticus TaxID=79263 RepID=UPI001C47F096|nr:DedA family protein [Paenibacillus chitinolyticus]MBV6715861.1 DedA family protein [Paenibacillus chitinolyticus]